ncbi:MAG: hypothetical protein IJ060_11790 [Oscillospiraceae bacterium]|nr:hypothetical protein [Oscillospiraceae bacterium]
MKRRMTGCILAGCAVLMLSACGSSGGSAGSSVTETTVDPKVKEYEELQAKFEYVIGQAAKRSDGKEFLIRDYEQYYADVEWDEEAVLPMTTDDQLASCVITYSDDHSEINFLYDDSVHTPLHIYMKYIYEDLGVKTDIDAMFEDHDSISAKDGLITITGEKSTAGMNELFEALGAPSVTSGYAYNVTVKLEKP